MKNYIILVCLVLFAAFSVTAQEKNEHREKIRTLKIAYITEEISLTVKEAQQFWPIYNKHYGDTHTFIRNGIIEIKNEIKEAGDIDGLTDKKVAVLFEKLLSLEKKKYEANQQYIADLKQVISVKKILKLQMAEMEFGKKLMRKYREKRASYKN